MKITALNFDQEFWLRVHKAPGCWEWIGTRDAAGYGVFTASGKKIKAHRAPTIWNGTSPTTLCVDHICRNRACVNPAHLRLVDLRTNALENSEGNAAKNMRKTLCQNGHPLDGVVNRANGKTFRYCKTCKRKQMANLRNIHDEAQTP